MKENPLPLMNEGLGELRVSRTLFYVGKMGAERCIATKSEICHKKRDFLLCILNNDIC